MRASFLVVLLAVSSTGCGQTRMESLNERVANRLATQELIKSVVSKQPGAPGEAVIRMVAGRDDLSLDLQLAFAAIIPYSVFRDVNYKSAVDSSAGLLEVETRLGTAVLTNLAGDAQFAANVLSIHSAVAGVVNRSNTPEKFELEWNQKMDTQQAEAVVELAARLTLAKQKETRDRLKSTILQAMQRHPELVRPFAEQKSPSDDLKKSRQRVKALLDEAAKKHR